jgi:hypothetical protein
LLYRRLLNPNFTPQLSTPFSFFLVLGLTVGLKKVKLRTRLALFVWYLIAAYGGTSEVERTGIRIVDISLASAIVGLIFAVLVWVIGTVIARRRTMTQPRSGDAS